MGATGAGAVNPAIWLAVMVIGGFGATARFLLDRAVSRRVTRPFPYGTLAVNISGALALGFVSGLVLSHEAALLAGTALIGAYTTFSTWMLETHRLAEDRQIRPALGNIVVSVALGIPATVFGQWIAGFL
ncbi:MAG: fluoride efflux transporter CrcB [Mycobacterium sp.]